MEPYRVEERTRVDGEYWAAAKGGIFCRYIEDPTNLAGYRFVDLPGQRGTKGKLYHTHPSKTHFRPILLIKRSIVNYVPLEACKEDGEAITSTMWYDLSAGRIDGFIYKKRKDEQIEPLCPESVNLTHVLDFQQVVPHLSLDCHVAQHFEAVTAGLAHQYNMSLLQFVEAEETRLAEERAYERVVDQWAALLTDEVTLRGVRTGSSANSKRSATSMEGHYSQYVLLKRERPVKTGDYFAAAPSQAVFMQPMVLPTDSKLDADVKRKQTAGIGLLGTACANNKASPSLAGQSHYTQSVNDLWRFDLGKRDPTFYTVHLGTVDGGFDGKQVRTEVDAFKSATTDTEEIKSALRAILPNKLGRGTVSAISGIPYNYTRGSEVIKRTSRSLSLSDWMAHETFKAYAERLRTRLKRGRSDDEADFAVLAEDEAATYNRQQRLVSCSMEHRLHEIGRFCSHAVLCLLKQDPGRGISALSKVLFEEIA